MINPMELTGKRIMVTGASSGIGRETAILLSNLGAQVVLLGRDEQRLAETKDNLSGDGHVSISLELREFEKYADAFKQIKETGKKLDGFVHCAGIAKVIPLKVVSANVIQDMFAVNYVSFMELIKHFAKKTNSDGGSVVCLSAINAHYPQKCMSVYAATKGALEMAVSSLAVELFEKKNPRECSGSGTDCNANGGILFGGKWRGKQYCRTAANGTWRTGRYCKYDSLFAE